MILLQEDNFQHQNISKFQNYISSLLEELGKEIEQCYLLFIDIPTHLLRQF